METSIPFGGFYDSIHGQNLEYAIEMIFHDDRGDPNSELLDRAYSIADWKRMFLEYAKVYTEGFADRFDLKTLKFKELHSPREYNFTTDRIFCEIELEEVRRIFAAVDKELLQKAIKEQYTSYDGFISFYKNDLAEWPSDLEEWDANQVGTLVHAYIVQENDNKFDQWDEHETLGEPYTEVLDALVYDVLSLEPEGVRIVKIGDYLRDREQRACNLER